MIIPNKIFGYCRTHALIHILPDNDWMTKPSAKLTKMLEVNI